MNRLKRSVTLVELLIAIALLSLIGLAFASIDLFSRHHVISSDRRVKLQNELSFALETMHKSVSMGVGYLREGSDNRPPIETLANGFQVRIDATPDDLTDDDWDWVTYTLASNTLSSSDPDVGVLSSRIVAGVEQDGQLPDDPALIGKGFYIQLLENSTVIEVGLVARWKPDDPSSVDNPQISLKSKMFTRSASVK